MRVESGGGAGVALVDINGLINMSYYCAVCTRKFAKHSQMQIWVPVQQHNSSNSVN